MPTLLDIKAKQPFSKDAYKSEVDEVRRRLIELQRLCYELHIPMIVALHGLGASGKGRLTGELLRDLDPRGFAVHTIKDPGPDDLLRPYLWRFWNALPENGRLAVFLRSWYSSGFNRDKGCKSAADRSRLAERINVFERQLTDGGYAIIKFYLVMSEAEQRKRFKALEADPDTAWRVTKQDWKDLDRHHKLLTTATELIDATNKSSAPWVVLPADNWRFAAITMMRAVADRLQQAVTDHVNQPTAPSSEVFAMGPSVLDSADLSQTVERDAYQKELDDLQERFRLLQFRIYRKRVPVAIAFEGWDAAGKGGSIKRLVRALDPRGFDVIPVAAPTPWEKNRHYLWRFWIQSPRAGHVAVFDRTWYGRVLVERVEGFCTPVEWERAYREICEMEKDWADAGAVIFKFWLHISKDEQLRRFKARENTPEKSYKITPEDYRNREKWDLYKDAVEAMVQRTSTDYAPWTVVESDSKPFARLKVLRTVVEGLEKKV